MPNSVKSRLAHVFGATKERIAVLEQARIEQQKDISALKEIKDAIIYDLENFTKRVERLENLYHELERTLSERLADMRQRIEDIALAYAEDPRRKEAEPKPEEQTPIIKGVTPFSMRRRAFEVKHSNPKRVAEKMLAPKETAVKEPS